MCEYQDYYEAFKTAYWRDEDAEKCRCKGTGWALSEVDTWHECPIHFDGQKHPNDESDDDIYGYSDNWSPEFLAQQLDPHRMVCLVGTYDVCLSMALWDANIKLREKFSDEDDDLPF